MENADFLQSKNYVEENTNFDIIQLPKWIKMEDIPSSIKIDESFKIKDETFVLTKSNLKDLEICSVDNSTNSTSVPFKANNYYTIKRL